MKETFGVVHQITADASNRNVDMITKYIFFCKCGDEIAQFQRSLSYPCHLLVLLYFLLDCGCSVLCWVCLCLRVCVFALALGRRRRLRHLSSCYTKATLVKWRSYHAKKRKMESEAYDFFFFFFATSIIKDFWKTNDSILGMYKVLDVNMRISCLISSDSYQSFIVWLGNKFHLKMNKIKLNLDQEH